MKLQVKVEENTTKADMRIRNLTSPVTLDNGALIPTGLSIYFYL